MGELIRIVVYNPNTGTNALACLERPLQWRSVVEELYEASGYTGVDVTPDTMPNLKICVFPSGNSNSTPVSIRKNNLDRSIRDGDMLLLDISGITGDSKSQSALTQVHPVPAQLAPPTLMPKYNTNNGMAPSPTSRLGVGGSSKLKKRGRSLSSKFWLVNKLAETTGRISKEQKDVLKFMLISGEDSAFDEAFAQYENTGDISELIRISSKKSCETNSLRPSAMFGSESEAQLAREIESELNLFNVEDLSFLNSPSPAQTSGVRETEGLALPPELLEVQSVTDLLDSPTVKEVGDAKVEESRLDVDGRSLGDAGAGWM